MLSLAQLGLTVKREREDKEREIDEENRRMAEEKRRIEEEERRVEEARAELQKERDGILSNEYQKFFCFVQNHLRVNARLSPPSGGAEQGKYFSFFLP